MTPAAFLPEAVHSKAAKAAARLSYQDESLRPLTIKQILDAEEPYSGADFKVDGAPITQITFVGQVRSINPQQTNLTIKVDDGTGQIDVKKWIDVDKQSDAEPGFEIDSHIRVWGRLKSFSNKRHVGAHVIRPVTDFNEVNYHMLEATYVHLFYTRGAVGGPNAGDANGDSMFVDGGDGYNAGGGAAAAQTASKLSGCSNKAKNMFMYLKKSSDGTDGVHLNKLTAELGLGLRDVMEAADELMGLGLIYTTIDEETWAVLEY
ncbi:replication protein A, subunit RPA32 [Trichoderma citrinoviride]|uniref:Replication protein A, subunit RPA32 n=1 Tax=Trichoderma citrinoviride TaxID=58853 RepID=A0A2T4BN40_9HYPO|nr:replication protein A, subunit RPA32 [Trichoderma citrinoviride]PTB70679.1 replication protein A, subunit RPA32 [Trichoderma citrinoviride]